MDKLLKFALEAHGALNAWNEFQSPGGQFHHTLGDSAGRKATIDVTDLIWNGDHDQKLSAVCSAACGLAGTLEYHRPAASILRNQSNSA